MSDAVCVQITFCDGLYGFLLWQSLLRLSFGSMGAAAVAGFSPDTTTFQPGSLPSSVSDALEAVVGQGVDDLSLDDLETGIPYAGEGQVGGGTESEVRREQGTELTTEGGDKGRGERGTGLTDLVLH